MTSTQFFPMSLPMILSSGNKGDRWGLCFVDSSWSPSSSSNLSLGNPSRASDWNWGLQAFSWEHGGVRKTDDGEVSNEGVMRPVLMRLRSWSPGDSGVKKQLGSSGWLLFFLWCLSVCSMATLNYGRSAAESKIAFVSRSLLCVDDWRLVKTFWFNRQIANTMWQPITASYFFPAKIAFLRAKPLLWFGRPWTLSLLGRRPLQTWKFSTVFHWRTRETIITFLCDQRQKTIELLNT